ncbi:hypothetical protein D3C72_1775690 [compost metagenome]
MAVLPPTEESTWASRVVGTCTKSTPRMNRAAASPARSPTTPPPSATTMLLRSSPSASSRSSTASSCSKDLDASPAGTVTIPVFSPAPSSAARTVSPWMAATVSSLTIKARVGARAATRAPASFSSPRPTTTS